MCLSCTVFEIKPVIRRKSPILTHPTCIRRLVGGDPGRICRICGPSAFVALANLRYINALNNNNNNNFAEIFGIRKLESLGYRVVLFV